MRGREEEDSKVPYLGKWKKKKSKRLKGQAQFSYLLLLTSNNL